MQNTWNAFVMAQSDSVTRRRRRDAKGQHQRTFTNLCQESSPIDENESSQKNVKSQEDPSSMIIYFSISAACFPRLLLANLTNYAVIIYHKTLIYYKELTLFLSNT